MAGSNGFGTLAQLKALRRLEKTYTDWPVMKIRLQALTDDEIERCSIYAKANAADPNDESLRILHDRNAQLAFGIVAPPVAEVAQRDFDEAVALLDTIPPGVKSVLAGEILMLTYRKASEAYKDFNDGEGSQEAVDGTVVSITSSANS